MAAPQAPPSLGFSRQEHWNVFPFRSPMHESENEVAQSCPTLSDSMGCSLPVSFIHGIFQARVLEWGAIAFSNLVTKQQQTPETERFAQSMSTTVQNYGSPSKGQVALQTGKKICILTPVQFSSVAHSCLTLCNPMDCRLPGFLVHHQLLELTQTHVH